MIVAVNSEDKKFHADVCVSCYLSLNHVLNEFSGTKPDPLFIALGSLREVYGYMLDILKNVYKPNVTTFANVDVAKLFSKNLGCDFLRGS